LKRSGKTFSVEYGISPFNPTNLGGPREFATEGRDVHLFSFSLGRVIGTKGKVTYEYFFSAIPLAIFARNEVTNPAFVSPAATPSVSPTLRETTYGVGIQPLNFRFIFLPKKRLKPYAQAGGGLLFTNKAVPVPNAKSYNLIGDFGGGLMYLMTRKHAVNIGYKYFHISNANINGKINNPGLNANTFYASYSVLFK